MKIAYVIDTFPRKSELFLRREIAELRRQGVAIQVFSVCRPADPDPDAAYLPRFTLNIPGIVSAALTPLYTMGMSGSRRGEVSSPWPGLRNSRLP